MLDIVILIDTIIVATCCFVTVTSETIQSQFYILRNKPISFTELTECSGFKLHLNRTPLTHLQQIGIEVSAYICKY